MGLILPEDSPHFPCRFEACCLRPAGPPSRHATGRIDYKQQRCASHSSGGRKGPDEGPSMAISSDGPVPGPQPEASPWGPSGRASGASWGLCYKAPVPGQGLRTTCLWPHILTSRGVRISTCDPWEDTNVQTCTRAAPRGQDPGRVS